MRELPPLAVSGPATELLEAPQDRITGLSVLRTPAFGRRYCNCYLLYSNLTLAHKG
jgi:hypothetical protein